MARMERVPEDSPERCQSTFAHGQCPYKQEPGSQTCIMHGGNKVADSLKKRAVHDYQLQMYQERVDLLAGSERVKNLRGEIGILRMTLEHILNQIKTPMQFPLFVDKISALTRDIRSAVETCQKMEERNRELLTKTEVFNIADTVIRTIVDYIKDPDDLAAVGEALYESITTVVCGENPFGDQPKINNGRK